eukprot:augustus_masked-scaffold_18-processed-gene-5.10-mRNA-1 protein AED:1.00 eAED:1.00 QI:0/-1/0/0/-1/1/1/0/674
MQSFSSSYIDDPAVLFTSMARVDNNLSWIPSLLHFLQDKKVKVGFVIYDIVGKHYSSLKSLRDLEANFSSRESEELIERLELLCNEVDLNELEHAGEDIHSVEKGLQNIRTKFDTLLLELSSIDIVRTIITVLVQNELIHLSCQRRLRLLLKSGGLKKTSVQKALASMCSTLQLQILELLMDCFREQKESSKVFPLESLNAAAVFTFSFDEKLFTRQNDQFFQDAFSELTSITHFFISRGQGLFLVPKSQPTMPATRRPLPRLPEPSDKLPLPMPENSTEGTFEDSEMRFRSSLESGGYTAVESSKSGVFQEVSNNHLLADFTRQETEKFKDAQAETGLYDDLTEEERTSLKIKLQDDLKKFCLLVDGAVGGIVEALFIYFHFSDILSAVYSRYEALPEGWREVVEQNNSLKNILGVNQVKYLGETSYQPWTRPALEFPMRNSDIEHVVDEFISTERRVYDKLNFFLTKYVNEISGISSDLLGPHAKSALGLDRRDIQLMFGKTIKKVLRGTKAFVDLLDILVLVPKPMKQEIIHKGGRPKVLVDIILKSGNVLKSVYLPYMNSYATATRRLTERVAALNQNRTARIGNNMNFIDIYEEIASGKSVLNQTTIQSVLYIPVARFPQYPLLLEKLLKECGKVNHPATKKVAKGHKFVVQLNEAINKAMASTRDSAT